MKFFFIRMKKYFLSSPKYSFFRLKNIIAFQIKRLNFVTYYNNPTYKGKTLHKHYSTG